MPSAKLTVIAKEPIGTISPLIHGQFAEHLGRCCYDGLWVGKESSIPNVNGFAKDVLEALKKVNVSMLRWPGGCFADSYHWRDGIGPTEKRPKTLGESCGLRVVETNELGTHEFIWLCRQLGAEPYLAGNVGSGTPQEMADWLHYCNSDLDTDLVALRKANGHAETMNVKYWGVGNENWGCGGNYDPEGYGKEYRRYATFLKQTDDRAELVACGLADRQWNLKLVETLRNHPFLVDHLSVHRYYSGGKAAEYDDGEYWDIMKGALEVEEDLQYSSEILNFFFAGRKKVGVAMDEWGVWHPEATSDKNYEAPSTLRDAVAAAAVLDVFQKRCDVVSMANLAQIVNVLQCLIQTDGPNMWVTPTYHLFAIYSPHQGAQAVRVDLETEQVELKDETKVGVVSASASVKDGKLTVSASNRHPSEPMDLEIAIIGASVLEGSAELLSGDSPKACNSASEPDRVSVASAPVAGGTRVRAVLPPCSVQTMVWPCVPAF